MGVRGVATCEVHCVHSHHVINTEKPGEEPLGEVTWTVRI